MNPAYFQAAALTSAQLHFPTGGGGPPDDGGGAGYDFIVSSSPYTPPTDPVNFTTD